MIINVQYRLFLTRRTVYSNKANIVEYMNVVDMILGSYWKTKTGWSSSKPDNIPRDDIRVEVGDTGRIVIGCKAVGIMEGILFY